MDDPDPGETVAAVKTVACHSSAAPAMVVSRVILRYRFSLKKVIGIREGLFMKDYTCPVCDADIIMDGDEKPGDRIYCSYCNSTIKIHRQKGSDDFKLVDDN
jgi:hypothetical protein